MLIYLEVVRFYFTGVAAQVVQVAEASQHSW
jgi:hypothetical protein